MLMTLILVCVTVLVLLIAVPAYIAFRSHNRLVALDQRCNTAFADIDAHLKHRHNLIPPLVEAVRVFTKHENDVLLGVTEARAYTKQESARLVEPWLGGGLSLDDLPIPRLIVVKLASGVLPDFEALRRALAAQVAGATLDDHRRWIDRMRTMAGTAVAAGVAVLALVLAVTVLSVTFATRGAMATNRPIIEVLHYVGATDGFIAGQFQRHFLLLGFKGGAIGGGAAIFFFGAAEAANAWLAGTAGGDQAAALFGNVSIGVSGYLAILTQVILMAMVTALASRRTVNRTLETMD